MFLVQRRQVELAIRRLIKLELLAELHKMNDREICEVIKRNHDIDTATGKIHSNTSEIALDMTLVKIIKLGYSGSEDIFSLRRLISSFMKKNQTQVQKAIYAAFEDFKKSCSNSSQALVQFKSKTAIQQFKDMIKKYL